MRSLALYTRATLRGIRHRRGPHSTSVLPSHAVNTNAEHLRLYRQPSLQPADIPSTIYLINLFTLQPFTGYGVNPNRVTSSASAQSYRALQELCGTKVRERPARSFAQNSTKALQKLCTKLRTKLCKSSTRSSTKALQKLWTKLRSKLCSKLCLKPIQSSKALLTRSTNILGRFYNRPYKRLYKRPYNRLYKRLYN